MSAAPTPQPDALQVIEGEAVYAADAEGIALAAERAADELARLTFERVAFFLECARYF